MKRLKRMAAGIAKITGKQWRRTKRIAARIGGWFVQYWIVLVKLATTVGSMAALAIGCWWLHPAAGLIVPALVLILWRFMAFFAPLLLKGAKDNA